MRARYSAFVLRNDEFVLASWHPDTRPDSVGETPTDHEWLGLEILTTTGGGALDSEGTVEFAARFRRGADHFALHERSTFARVGGKWLYVDGVDASD